MMVKLKEIREAAGLTQEKVASDLGVKLGTYRSWEQGHRGLNGKKLSMLADYFNTTADNILGYTATVYEVASFPLNGEPKENPISADANELLAIYTTKLSDDERRLLLKVARSMTEGKEE